LEERVKISRTRRSVLSAVAAAAALATLAVAPAVADGDIEPANVIPVSADDSPDVLEAKAAHVIPTERQLEWQQQQQTAFVHFNMPTYLNVEGGDGRAAPEVFDPTALDTDQWARSLKAGGYKLVVLTVKHADGYLLYPSGYSDYSVENSPYKNGQGDILREFIASMRAEGLRVGIYFSPLNRHEGNVVESEWNAGYPRYGYSAAKGERSCAVPETPVAGKPAFTFETDEYNCLYMRQLYEIFGEYGPIDEWWIDGNATSYKMGGSSWDGWKPADWPNAAGDGTQQYDNASWYKIAKALQPDMLAFNGWDIRWVGNETGFARVGGEWSTIAVSNDPGDAIPERTGGGLPGDAATWTGAKNLVWMPTEVDVPMSAQGNWFYHEGDTQKSLDQLWHIYAASIGRNANLLLDFTPDRTGVIPEAQVTRSLELKAKVDQVFGRDLAGKTPLHVSRDALTVERKSKTPVTVDWIGLSEDVEHHGQRVEAFTVETWNAGSGRWERQPLVTWDKAGKVIPDTASRIGLQRYLHFEQPVTTTKVRVTVTDSRLAPHIDSLTLHHE
jgi:alpha-L-fucosidase